MRKGLAHAPIVIVFLLLVSLAVWLAFARVGAGKAEDIMNFGTKIAGALSFCKDVGVKDYTGMMAELKNVYENCGKGTCDSAGCEKMTLSLPAGTPCYKIGQDQIDAEIGYQFDELGWGVRTPCGVSNRAFWQDEIDIYNAYGNTEPYCKFVEIPIIAYGEYFEIVNGATVTVKATKPDNWGNSVDLNFKIKGGSQADYSTSCPYPPTSKNIYCGNDNDCLNKAYVIDGSENNHIYCNSGKCVHDGYCKHICDAHSSDCTTNLNNPAPSKKCVKMEVICTAGGTCPETIAKCPAKGTSVTITGWKMEYDKKFIHYETTPFSYFGGVDTILKGENYFNLVSPTMQLTYDGSRPAGFIDMSLAFTSFSANKAEIYLGCY